jgi:phosphoglycerol transferase MdoB-like AlkP superfamily enzyme
MITIKPLKNIILSILAICSALIVFIAVYFLIAGIKFDLWLSEINKSDYVFNIDTFSPIMIISLFLMLLVLQMNHLKKQSVTILFSTLIISGIIYGVNILPENQGILYARYYYFVKDINREAEEKTLQSDEYKELLIGQQQLNPYILYKYLYVQKNKLIREHI